MSKQLSRQSLFLFPLNPPPQKNKKLLFPEEVRKPKALTEALKAPKLKTPCMNVKHLCSLPLYDQCFL